MRNCKFLCASVLLAAACVGVRDASAQSFESIGVRAQGLGGAFVGLADDATASWWNPAGLATGAYLSAVIEKGRTTEPVSPTAQGPAVRTTSADVAVAFPSLGLSYYRLRISEIAAPATTAGASANRQDPGETGSGVRSVAISQFGTTVGQSLTDHLVVGATLKLLRAGAVQTLTLGTSPLDDADGLDVARQTRADLDVGAMANLGHLRLGLTVKNLTQPSFGDGLDTLTLKRHARAGMALLSAPHGAQQGWIAAFDADLTTTTTAVGESRHVAAGLERWLTKGRVGVRAGASANTVGDARPAVSGGVTVGLTKALRANASRTLGRDESVTGWSTSVSVAF